MTALTILSENTVRGAGLLGEHGLAYWLDTGTLIGGLHLAAASPERMDRTVAALHALAPRRMVFGHCTGAHAIHRLWNEFPAACCEMHAGKRLRICAGIERCC
jgi:hypothetical protein